MAQIVIPTNGSVGAPLLIEEKHLVALDKVLEDFVAERKRTKKGDFERSVVIYLTAGRTVKAESFADAIKQPHVTNEEPLGFRASVEGDEIKATVSLTKLALATRKTINPNQTQTVQLTPQLEFNVEPSEKEAAQELFGALQNWAAEFAPSDGLRMWARFRLLFASLLLIWIVLVALLGTFRFPISNDYQDQAFQILQKGVNEDNQRKAIEVILGIVSKNQSPESKAVFNTRPGKRYWSVAIGVAFALFCLSLCPSIVIGIWKGKRTLDRWRVWIRFILVTIPGILLGSILIPRLLQVLGF
jgi:hypothetical protein